jgi:cation diffusion facilitator CzcD-associated flavoprotein CzcO
MPMQRPPEQDCQYDFYKAKYSTKYFEDYVDRKDSQGRSLRDRIVFDRSVKSIRKTAGIWTLVCQSQEGRQYTFSAKKVLVASGLTSVPSMPNNLKSAGSFDGPIIHSVDFGSSSLEILSRSDIHHVTILGGGKSAADMVYEVVKSGKTVSWVIRAHGTGAPFLVSGKGKGPFRNAFEAASTRFVSSLNPSIFIQSNVWTNFVHRSSVGVSLLQRMLASVDAEIRRVADYQGGARMIRGSPN